MKPHSLGTSQRALIFLLFLGTIFIYSPVVHYPFLHIDDALYVSENPHISQGLTLTGIKWALSADLISNSNHADYWQPFTFLSHMADIELFGNWAGGHHAINLLLHLINGLLILLILFHTTNRFGPSALVTALFLLHPLQTETVAWITARKDLLSAFFLFISIRSYIQFASNRSRTFYLISLTTFACSLMSKPIFLTYPVLLCLIDYWPINRNKTVSIKQLVIEKIPFLLASLTILLLLHHAQTMMNSTFAEGFLSFSRAFMNQARYLGKIILPINLALYTTFTTPPPNWIMVFTVIGVISASVLTIFYRETHPSLLVGWFWFLVSAPINFQILADRMMYVPMIGILILTVFSLYDHATKKLDLRIQSFLVTAVLIVLILSSYCQLSYWRSDRALLTHALDVNPRNPEALTDLAAFLASEGNLDEAKEKCETALNIKPNHDPALTSLAILEMSAGNWNASEKYFKILIARSPSFVIPYYYYGLLLEKMDRPQEAKMQYKQALRISPDFKDAQLRLETLQTTVIHQ